MPAIADGEKRYLRVTRDESTFYANADQTRFWHDGQSQVLRQKSLGSSIMVSDFIVEGHGYLKDDEEAARLYLETQKGGILMTCLLHKWSVRSRFLRENFRISLAYFYLIMHQAIRNLMIMLSMLVI